MESCQLVCDQPPYIPSRKTEDIQDLPNPFTTAKLAQNKCNYIPQYKEGIFKLEKISRKDDIFIILCFILFLLFAKLFYFQK